MAVIIILALIFAYLYWRLAATNTDIRPQDDYTADDTWNGPVQTVHYIQPREGEIIPRA